MVIGLKQLVKIGQILPLESNVNVSLIHCPITLNFNSSPAANAKILIQAQQIKMLKDKVYMYKQLYKKQRKQNEQMRKIIHKLEKENEFYKANKQKDQTKRNPYKANMATNQGPNQFEQTFLYQKLYAIALALLIEINCYTCFGIPGGMLGVCFWPFIYAYSTILFVRPKMRWDEKNANDFESRMS